jgi:hypothetical protein
MTPYRDLGSLLRRGLRFDYGMTAQDAREAADMLLKRFDAAGLVVTDVDGNVLGKATTAEVKPQRFSHPACGWSYHLPPKLGAESLAAHIGHCPTGTPEETKP